MKKILLLALLHSGNALNGQSYGYLFAGLGAERGSRDQNFVHGGLGGEWHPARYIGLGGEGGVIAAREFGGAFALLSANAVVHIPTAARLDPFAVAGVGVASNFTSGYVMPNVGAGANYWGSRLGFRLEFRYWHWSNAARQLYELRFGLTFR